MWRIVGIRVELPCHNVEVDDAVLELRVRFGTYNAQVHVPKDEAVVFYEYFIAGCCDIHCIEIRPRNSPITGGFGCVNEGSTYVLNEPKKEQTWNQ